jgi:tRNA (cmo5U34)-methyltransferase
MNSTLHNFSFQANVYDSYQKSCIPKYEEMNSIAAGFVGHVLGGIHTPRILDLGCGTGNTSIAVKGMLSDARVSCVDGSEEMLNQARKKLTPRFGPDMEYSLADLGANAWTGPWKEETFDAVISVLVLEHLPFGSYRAVVEGVGGLLSPGGWFVAVEGYGGALNQELFFGEMARWEERAIAEQRITSTQLLQIKEISAQNEKHYYSTMDEKRQWWIESGFSDVGFIWQYYCVAILVGRKLP